MKNGSVIKKFDVWKDGKKEEQEKSFSYQLLEELRDKRKDVDIMDVRELLELGADPNYKLMVHTSEEEYQKQLDFYRDNEISGNPNMRAWMTATIGYAIILQSTRPDIMEAMIEYDVDPNLDTTDVPMVKGPTPFYGSAVTLTKNLESHQRILTALVKMGAKVNVKNSQGNNVIHSCALFGNLEIIPTLIKLGVNPFEKNNDGKTPYDLLHEYRYGLTGEIIPDSEDVSRKKQELSKILMPPASEPKQKSKFGFFGKK